MKKSHLWHARVSCFATLLYLSACGTDEKKRASDDGSGASENQVEKVEKIDEGDMAEMPFDHVVTPPKEYYSQLLFEDSERLDEGFELANADSQVLFVNFDGATLKRGYGKGQSFILCKSEATIAPTGISVPDRTTILQLVAKHFETAGAKLLVTDQKPNTGDFTTLIVGGSYSSLGCIGPGVLGVAPFDVGNKNRNDIGFAFTPKGVSNRVIAETISHEAGHSFGLNHVMSRTDIMFASSSSQIDKFGVGNVIGGLKKQDAPAILVSVLGAFDGNNLPGGVILPQPPSSPTPVPQQPLPQQPIPQQPNNGNGQTPIPGGIAQLPGLDKLAAIVKLLPILGGASGCDITQLLPGLQALIPGAGSASFPGLDKILQIQQLLAALGNGQGLGTGSLAGLPGMDLKSILVLVQSLMGNQGALSAIANLLNLAQGPNIAAIIQNLIQGGLGGLGGAGNVAGQVPSLPDLTQILNIPKGSSSAALVGEFRTSAQFVQTNYEGDEREALLSLLKVAYAQAINQAP